MKTNDRQIASSGVVIPMHPGHRWFSGILGLILTAFAGILFVRYFRMSTSSTLAMIMTLLTAAWAARTFQPNNSFADAQRQRHYIPILIFFVLIPLAMYKLYLHSNRDLSAFGEMIFMAFLGTWLFGAALRKPVGVTDQNDSPSS